MSEIKKLARLGGDVRKIAALLQSKGRGNDTILAHITPQEAALLRARGGSGTTNPETGLLEFEDDVGNLSDYQTTRMTPIEQGAFQEANIPAQELDPAFNSDRNFYNFVADAFVNTKQNLGTKPYQLTPDTLQGFFEPLPAGYAGSESFATGLYRPPEPFGPEMAAGTAAEMAATGTPPSAPIEPGLLKTLSQKTGMSEDFLKRLGLAGIQAIPGAAMQRRAARQAGAQRAELERMAAPYRSQAQALTAQAQAGQLTPVAQQQLQAARAQLAQGAERRGGVGAQQAAVQLEQFRQQLLQQQLDMGLKLSGIADRIQVGAIRAGYQADEQVQQMTADFYNNMFRTLFGQPAQQQPAPRA